MTPKALIAGYIRSPFAFAHKGELTKIRPDDLAVMVIKGLIHKVGIPPEDIEDVLLGCAFPEGEQGLNVARLIALQAGLPFSVAGATINRFCGSSMQAIHSAAGAIQAGAGEVFICAGVESMTRVPMGGFNPMPNPILYEMLPGAYLSMGETAENVAKRFNISRAAQEDYALKSHQRAGRAQERGNLDEEITPIPTPNGIIQKDSCIRPDTNLEALAALKPAFEVDGSVTAGTSSPLSDGAAAVLVVSETYARQNNIPCFARIKSMAVSGCDPEIMGIGPVAATHKALKRANLSIQDLDVVELNEAFASQTLACVEELGLDLEKVNIDGGAIALGHPLGATGARITGKAAALLRREKKKYALATQCIGGGQGIATILEAYE